ncbi:MAG: MFS transporter [Fluviicola sp.]|nr:MFS transporter [Fluviicola sp.]
MKAELKKQFIYLITTVFVALGSWLVWHFQLIPIRPYQIVLFLLIAGAIFLGMYFLANCMTLLKAINESKQQEDETSY